jgi:hypothetical protein
MMTVPSMGYGYDLLNARILLLLKRGDLCIRLLSICLAISRIFVRIRVAIIMRKGKPTSYPARAIVR